jgi:carbonic anhydrase/acetyltransferase-like protein (isoleucine patch superfamily)
MLFLIIQMVLIALVISLVYFVLLWVLSIDFSLFPTPLDGLAVILLTFFTSYIIMVLVMAFINKITRLLLKEKEGEMVGKYLVLWTIKETSWDIVQTITKKIIIHSPFPIIIARLFGFKLRKDVTILGYLFDLEMLEIGEGTLIGTFAAVSAHHIRRGRCYRKPVTIGKDCTIGGYVIVAPGAEIEDNVLVGACSFVPTNWVLDANSIYSGVPVKKVKPIDPSKGE